MEERRSEAEHLQELTEYLAFGGDDNLFEFCPEMYTEATDKGVLPSQLEHLPPMSKELGHGLEIELLTLLNILLYSKVEKSLLCLEIKK